MGLISTNTISQGDTRAAGLRWICTHHGHIYRATRRLKWPGLAAVVVSVVHIYKVGTRPEAPRRPLPPRVLDGRAVEQITAYLFHAGTHENPAQLEANKDKELILYCASGARSGVAASILRKEGFNAVNAGGFGNWSRAGLPVRKP